MNTRVILSFAILAAFGAGHAQDVAPAVKSAVSAADAAIAKIVAVSDSQRNFDNTLGAFDDLLTRLDTETALPIFMQNVSPDAKERANGRAAEEFVSNYEIELGKREDLYKAIKAYADTHPTLAGEQKRLLDFTMRDYHRSGMDLPSDKRDRLKAVEMEINKLGIEFEKNIADDDSRVLLTVEELKGVPKDTIDRLTKIGNVCIVMLDGPTYGAVMDFCQVATTRQKAQMMYRRRGGHANVEVLEKLLKLRDEEATLLGYANTVDYEVEVRMAKNSQTIAKFYEDLLPIVKAKADVDFAEFTEAKRKDTKDPKATFNPWDYSYYKNLLMKQKYAVDGEKVAEYFPMQRVVDGLFGITSSLYNIDYKDVTSQASSLGLPVWHPDVKLYEVSDKSSHAILGHIYTDLFPRPGKYTHAACWGLHPRKIYADGTVQLPLAALVCNFTKPTGDKPSLLPHDEVETFFHEFGHGLHNLLTQTQYGRFAGAAVARDFVEAPSQMMENWVWAPEVLNTFAKHYKTNQPIPASMLAGMKAARTLGSGIETEGQFFLGLMDQRFHTAPHGEADTTAIAQDVYEKVTPYKFVPGSYPQAAFGHLVGYQGAYYGYMWSLVYAQDMFQRFEELGLTSPKAGAYYREKILARGGSMDEMDMLKDYLGREPKMDAFLTHLGLTKKK